MPNGFSRFWETYPRRVGKLAAQKAFAKALKVATVDEIMAGVARYVEHKPNYADWAHPTTFLNQGRWMDEYEDRRMTPDRRQAVRQTPDRREWTCPHRPSCGSTPEWPESNRWRCDQRTFLEEARAARERQSA